MDLIGDYRILRLLGQGGMGKVYEAEERLSKRRVALKVLHPELANSDEGRRLFLNEMEILAGLDDPRLVRSLASFEAEGQLVMVLELLDGQTLREVLAGGRLPVTEAVRIASAMASALVAAHGQSPPVVHRDLKPENVMVCHDGKVKVMDFGIAKALTAVQKTHTQTVGTLAYMSPEQIDAKPAEPRSDLYALGLVLYELLTGKPPFVSASPRELLNLQCTAEPPPLLADVRRGVPKTIERLLFQLLEKDPAARPASAVAVVEVLEPYLPADDERIAPVSRSAAAEKPATSANVPVEEPSRPTPVKPAARGRDAERRAELQRRDADHARPNDTLALLDDAVPPSREISTRVSVGVIVLASLLAAVTGYAVKRGSTPPSAAPFASSR
jgi:serine/threonine-protein kinase